MVLDQLWLIAGVIGSFVSVLFIISIFIKRNDIADVAWGTGIFLVALSSFLFGQEPTALTTTLLILAALWGGRLSLRILLRNLKKDEDYRYKKWRDEWGSWFYPRSFFQIYLLQGALMIVVGYSFIHASVYSDSHSLGGWYAAGLLIWLIGFFFEVVGDYQLDRFLGQPENRGRIMDRGLWRYSRHPNYFGEVVMWWGIWLMVVTLPFGYLAIISPLTITFLILKVSGIPMLEKKFAGQPDFEAYKKRTSAFFPLPPRRRE